jgi:phosphatidate phosphatase APP1
MVPFHALARSILVMACVAALTAPAVAGSSIKSDEEVMFFRTSVPADPTGNWQLPVNGWVFEPERDSWSRKLLLKALARTLGLPAGSEELGLFQSRAEMFLVDSERGKQVQVKLGPGVTPMPKSASTGLFEGMVTAPSTVSAGGPPAWIRYSAELPPGDARRFEGQVQVVKPEGLGVISDIDDTIKVTVVLDRKEMLRNTFLRPFQAVPGMASAYERWAAQGAVFHYVSGSPWQLYPHLVKFMDDAGFPAGAYHLRSIGLFKRPAEDATVKDMPTYKLPAIERVLVMHPRRSFVLVGDSGEYDPEIYGEIARRYPTRIRRIFIRRAPHADESEARYAKAFDKLPRELWSTFAEPSFPANP